MRYFISLNSSFFSVFLHFRPSVFKYRACNDLSYHFWQFHSFFVTFLRTPCWGEITFANSQVLSASLSFFSIRLIDNFDINLEVAFSFWSIACISILMFISWNCSVNRILVNRLMFYSFSLFIFFIFFIWFGLRVSFDIYL